MRGCGYSIQADLPAPEGPIIRILMTGQSSGAMVVAVCCRVLEKCTSGWGDISVQVTDVIDHYVDGVRSIHVLSYVMADTIRYKAQSPFLICFVSNVQAGHLICRKTISSRQ
jgi:hypothetical protein